MQTCTGSFAVYTTTLWLFQMLLELLNMESTVLVVDSTTSDIFACERIRTTHLGASKAEILDYISAFSLLSGQGDGRDHLSLRFNLSVIYREQQSSFPTTAPLQRDVTNAFWPAVYRSRPCLAPISRSRPGREVSRGASPQTRPMRHAKRKSRTPVPAHIALESIRPRSASHLSLASEVIIFTVCSSRHSP